MFLALLFSQIAFAGSYDLRFLESELFNNRDRARLNKYLSDEYLIFQKQKSRAKYSEQLFRYLRDSGVEEIRKEIKANPFAGLDWPDNLEGLHYLMLKIENDQ